MVSINSGSINRSGSLNRSSSINLPTIEEEPPSPSLINYFIILPIILFQAYHLVSLPLKITFDGHWYIYLSHLISRGFTGSADFSTWDFLRTPIYPALISFSNLIFGLSAVSLKLAATLPATMGILVLCLINARYLKMRFFAVPLIFVSLFPQFIIYQHCALSETTTFFFMTVIMWAALNYFDSEEKLAAIFFLILSIVFGYYARPTLAYLLIPIIYAIFSCDTVKARALLHSASIVFFSLLFILPWQFKMASSGREASQVAFAIINQALIEPGTDGFIEPEYSNAVNNSRRNGELTVSGVFDPYVYSIGEKLQQKYKDDLRSHFFDLVMEQPMRYFDGFSRGIQLLWGFEGLDSDNNAFKSAVLSDFPASAEIDPGIPDQEAFTRAAIAISPMGRTYLSNFLYNIYPYTHILIKAACLIALFIFFRGIIKRDPILLIMTGLPLFFTVFHAAILFSLDRMAVPAWPILISNIFMLFSLKNDRIA